MDLEGKLGGEVGGIAAGDYSGKGADGGVEGMDAGENCLVEWPVIARRVSRRFQFFSVCDDSGGLFFIITIGFITSTTRFECSSQHMFGW